MTKKEALQWIIKKISSEGEKLQIDFVRSLFCQLNSECTECPLFSCMEENMVICKKIKTEE